MIKMNKSDNCMKAILIIKNYDFDANGGASGNNDYPFVFDDGASECIDLPGIPAQGNLNPRSIFSDHALVVNNRIYDPSYGCTAESLFQYRNNNIAGWGIVLVQNGLMHMFTTNNVNNHQLVYFP